MSNGSVRLAREIEQSIHFKQDLASLLIVKDVRYRPRWSWEVERILEARWMTFRTISPRSLKVDRRRALFL